MLNICRECGNKKERCQKTCIAFKREVARQTGMRIKIKKAREKQKELDKAIWQTHKNGLKYDRQYRSRIKRDIKR